jgi:hypothetical protein
MGPTTSRGLPRPTATNAGKSPAPRCRASTDPKFGASPSFPSSTPVRPIDPALRWSPSKLTFERTRANRSERAAVFGNSSVTRTPVVRVGMVANGPRTSAGALGLGSNVSRWLGAPHSHSTMTDRARAFGAAVAARPANGAAADAVRNARRDTAPCRAEWKLPTASMGRPGGGAAGEGCS